MKLAVLTTRTPHHAFFVRALAEGGHDVVAFCETAQPPRQPFETHHPFEDERDRYEWGLWFDGKETDIADLAPTRDVSTMNDRAAVVALADEQADAVIAFGTGPLRAPVIAIGPDRIFNLHGGDPQEYRGLDTHLWAIFHRDFSGLVTTLHRVDAELDTGEIVGQEPIPLSPGMPLYALRAANTVICVQLAKSAAEALRCDGAVISRRQRRRGRYYSAMPADLKGVCKARFDAHVRKVFDGPR
jgi:methionyl-tRNA formyltransferase